MNTAIHAESINPPSMSGPARFDEDGFLSEPLTWSPELANSIARVEGIDRLSYEHWRILHFIRNYHERFGAVPLMRRARRNNRIERRQVEQLFQSCKSAWRIAGLPHPGEEANTYMN